MDELNSLPPATVKVQPGVNFTSEGVVKVTLAQWAVLRVWGPRVWNVGGRQVKVMAASACR